MIVVYYRKIVKGHEIFYITIYFTGAMDTEVVSAELDLTSIQDRDWSIHATCARNGKEVMSVFKDAVDKIKAFRHYKSGLTVKQSNKKQTEKTKSIQETGIEFTNIEIKDDNDKSDSLFESIKKQQELKNEVTETSSAVDISGGSSDSNPPEYDRPSTEYEIEDEEGIRAQPPDTVDDYTVYNSNENVKVTDLDEDTTDSETDGVEEKTDGNNEDSSVFEFEANAPVAVV